MSNIVYGNHLVVNNCYESYDSREYLGRFYYTRKGPGGIEYTFENKTLSGDGLRFRAAVCYENTNYSGGRKKTRRRKGKKSRSRKVRRN
jgi:hypothetical protein